MHRLTRQRVNNAAALAAVLTLAPWAEASATPSGAPELVITEVQQVAPEFLEIYNASAGPYQLKGVSLTGDLQYVFLDERTLQPGEAIVLAQSPRALRAAAESVWEVPCLPFRGRIRNEGGRIDLYDGQGRLLDAVRYGRAPGEGWSVQRRCLTTTYRGELNWLEAPETPGVVPPSWDLPELAADELDLRPRRARPNEGVVVSLRLHGKPPELAQVEWWGPGREGSAPLVQVGQRYEAQIPPQPDQSTTRYRIVLAGGGIERRIEQDPLSGEELRFLCFAPLSTQLPVYCLELAPGDEQALQLHPARQRFKANLSVAEPGRALRYVGDVELQAQGDEDRRRWAKRSWRVELREPYRGMKGLRLRTSWRDASRLRLVLGFDLYRRAGVLSPRARLVRVQLNGRFFGLYTEVEEVDQAFLRRNGLRSATVYRPRNPRGRDPSLQCDGRAYELPSHYEAAWYSDGGVKAFTALQRFVEGYQGADARAHLERTLDLERYSSYLAVTALLHHWDSVNRNFLWCYDRTQGRWSVIPWDLDRTWGDHYEGMWEVTHARLDLGSEDNPVQWGGRLWWNRLRTAFLAQSPFRALLRDRLAELLQQEFDGQRIGVRARALAARAKQELLLDSQRWARYASKIEGRPVDKPRTGVHLERDRRSFGRYARARASFLQNALDARYPRSSPAGPFVLLALGVGLGLYLLRGGLTPAPL
ncbi:MAG TPA: hypothetical protein DEA08_29970 [Planctomycetes bacterium]|nr:hypothetical protein [Planctomycetota bacterium]